MWALLPSAKHGGELRPHPFDVDATPKGMHEIARRVDGTLIAQHNPIFTGARYMTHYATCPDAPGFREQAEQMQLERQREYEYQVAEAAAEGKPEPYSPADLLEMDSRRLRSLLVGYGITHAIGNRETLRMMVETMQDEHHGDEWRDIAIRDISPEPPNDLFGETDEPATAAPVADLF